MPSSPRRRRGRARRGQPNVAIDAWVLAARRPDMSLRATLGSWRNTNWRPERPIAAVASRILRDASARSTHARLPRRPPARGAVEVVHPEQLDPHGSSPALSGGPAAARNPRRATRVAATKGDAWSQVTAIHVGHEATATGTPSCGQEARHRRTTKAKNPALQGLLDAPRETRTPTGLTPHKGLNLGDPGSLSSGPKLGPRPRRSDEPCRAASSGESGHRALARAVSCPGDVSGVHHDLAHLGVLECDGVRKHRRDPLAHALGGFLGLEDDHSQPRVVLPCPVPGYEPWGLRYLGYYLLAQMALGGLLVVDRDPSDDCV